MARETPGTPKAPKTLPVPSVKQAPLIRQNEPGTKYGQNPSAGSKGKK